MFAIEYAAWFGVMLPGLARLGIPVPLGGTSNHFRTDVLRAIGGWDAFNVTEDADVGLRLARAGHRVAPLASVTLEEANIRAGSWVRQRSRWLKGYMQTLLVHTREPVRFARAVGPARYLAALAFIGGAVVSPLLAPVLWTLSLFWALRGGGPEGVFYELLFMGGLVLGHGALSLLAAIAPYRTGERALMPWGLTTVVYWLLASPAAYKGLFQLTSGRSSFWEKTEHGLAHGRGRAIPWRPALAFRHAGLALIVLALSACAAFANAWLQDPGRGEAIGTVRLMRSADGFTGDGTNDGAFDLRAEYGVSGRVTLIADGEIKSDAGTGDARMEYARAGVRVALARWDGGILSAEGLAGAGAVRRGGGEPFFSSLHATGEARLLAGQGFTLFGDHAWASIEAGYRWRGGPPSDEAVLDATLGIQPRDDLLIMLQSFGVAGVGNAFDGYRRYNSEKLQLSVAYEVTERLWLQVGGIAGVAGTDAGDAGGMVSLWWRF